MRWRRLGTKDSAWIRRGLDVESYRDKLIAEQGEIIASLDSDDDAVVELDQTKVGRLSRMDAMQSQALAQDVRRRRQQRLLAITKALHRIDEDEFGYCLKCGNDMDTRRLDIDATAEFCVTCLEASE